MLVRPETRPVAHWSPTRRRVWRVWRFIRRWAGYWGRMSLAGVVVGVMVAGLYNQAVAPRFDYPQPQNTHAGP